MMRRFLCSIALGFASLTLADDGLHQVSVTLTAPPPEITVGDDGLHRVHIEGYSSSRLTGDPALPYRSFRILVPPDIVWDSLTLEVTPMEEYALPGAYDVAPTPPARAEVMGRTLLDWGPHQNLVDGRNLGVYSEDIKFPEDTVALEPYGRKRKWCFAVVGYSPVRYRPTTGTLTFCARAEVTLSFKRTPGGVETALLSDRVMEARIPAMVVNHKEGAAWYPPPTSVGGPLNDTHDYVIVTRQAIVDGSYQLDDFIVHLQSRGHDVRVVTEADYQGLTGQAPNEDADKIRQWLIDHYIPEGIEQVLLIGDPAPNATHSHAVPMKMCWPRLAKTSYQSAPTDCYYADLTGNWNPDGDEYFGTYAEWVSGGVDFAFEVDVGRIPVYWQNLNELDDILEKIMTYATSTQYAWRRSCLMPVTFSLESYSKAAWAEQMCDDFLHPMGYDTWRLYEQGNGPCGLQADYPSDEELRGGTVVRDRWLADDWGIVAWSGHGSSTGVQVGPNECPDGSMFNRYQAASLDDGHPSFVYQCSCLNGYPEDPDNLQYALLKNGAIGAVAASRVSWFEPSFGYGDFDITPDNAGLGYRFVQRLVNGHPAGRAILQSKEDAYGYPDASFFMNALVFNLFGDPALSIDDWSGMHADLQIQAAALTVTGTTIDMDLTIVNQSPDAPAEASRVGFFLSADTTVTPDDYLIGSQAVPLRQPGSVYYTGLLRDVRLIVPGIPQGTYYVGAILDLDDVVGEGSSGEANNVHVSPSPRVTVPGGIAAPTSIVATDGDPDLVQVSWNTAPEATHYRLFRSDLGGPGDAAPVSSWMEETAFDDTMVDLGRPYYYAVVAAISPDGAAASDYSMFDEGHVGPPLLEEDESVSLPGDTSYFQFTAPGEGWVVVGKRAYGGAENAWELGLYEDTLFQNLLLAAPPAHFVSFVLADLNHLARDTFAVKARLIGEYQGIQLEFEGADDALGVGTYSFDWYNYPGIEDIIKVFDVPLTPGTYSFRIKGESGGALPYAALYGSQGGDYYKHDQEFLAQAEGVGLAYTKFFTYTVTTSDIYALCVWAEFAGDIDITISQLMPGVWEGGMSDDWHTPGNWSDLLVPTASSPVTIPPGTTFSPVIDAAAACSNLLVEAGAVLSVGNATLSVADGVTVRGHLDLNDYATVEVDGNVTWEPGATADMVYLSSMDVGGDWTFEAGADVALANGVVRFSGPDSAWIRCKDSACRLFIVQNSKTTGFLGISGESTDTLRIEDWFNDPGTEMRCYSHYPVVIEGHLNNHGGNIRTFYGPLVFDGDPGATPLKMGTSSWIRSLVVRTTGNPLRVDNTYSNLLLVTEDLIIESGGLEMQDNHIEVGGVWSNGMGTAGFDGGSGTVTFLGSMDQDVFGENIFHALSVQKDGGTVTFHDPLEVLTDASFVNGTGVVHDVFHVAGVLDLDDPAGGIMAAAGGMVDVANLDLGGLLGCTADGTLVADDLVDAVIRGTLSLDGGQIDLYQGTSGGETLNLEGTVTITGGRLNIHGGFGPLRWTARDEDLLFTMSGGELNVLDQGISIWNGSGNLVEDISGGVIRSAKDFDCDRTDFRPEGGTLVMAAGAPALLEMPGPSYVHHLQIDAPGGVTITSNLTVHGDFTLSRGACAAPAELAVGGSWSNALGATAFGEGTGIVRLMGPTLADIYTDETFFDLVVDKTGTAYDALEIMPGIELQVLQDLSIEDGCLELNPNSLLDVGRDLLIETKAGLNANDDEVAIEVGGDWINRNTLYRSNFGFSAGDPIYGSSMVTFDGASSQTLHTDASMEQFHHLIIEQRGGTFRPSDDITVNGTCSLRSGTWRPATSGLTYRFNDNFTVMPAGVFDDDTCTIRFEGVDHQVFDDRSSTSAFGDFVVAKEQSSVLVSLASTLHCTIGHTLSVDRGILDLHAQSLICEGLLSVNDGGTLHVGDHGVLSMGDGQLLEVNRGGRLECLSRSGNPAVIQGFRGGRYGLEVNGLGELAASSAVFGGMDGHGIVVAAAGVIDPDYALASCTFQDGVAGGALLTVHNTQSLVIERAGFPTDAGKGSVNVRKTALGGELAFVAATGPFSGAGFEDDPHRRVHWHTGAPERVLLTGPTHATVGGTYAFEASVTGAHMFFPLTLEWFMTDYLPYQHVIKGTTGARDGRWLTSGMKTVSVTATNAEGDTADRLNVQVDVLEIADLVVGTDPTGSNTVVTLTLDGTSADSTYRVEFVVSPARTWDPAAPDGVSIPGMNRTTYWQDVGGPGRVLNATGHCYRAVLID